MTKGISRRTFVSAVAGAMSFPAIVRSAWAAETTLRVATIYPQDHPLNIRLGEAGQRIQKETGGKVELKIFANNQLGGQLNVLSQLRAGALDFCSLSGGIVSTMVPTTVLYGVPFAFQNYNQVWSALDGDVGKLIRDSIAKTDIFAFDKIWDNGFRQVTNSRGPINVPKDLANLKIRIGQIPIWMSTFAALKAAPTIVDWSETYTALRTRLVDAQENPLLLVEVAKLYEVQKYCSITNHAWDGMLLLGNKALFGSLPKNVQEIVSRNFNQAAMDERADLARMNNDLTATLTKQGMTFNNSAPEPFQRALSDAGFYKEWKSKFGTAAWSTLAKYSPGLP